MTKGFYRYYFHIGRIGIKLPRIRLDSANPILGFFCSCIMNILEYKRYRYYCKGKSYIQWNKIWKYKGNKPCFCPVYFSCGLFSITKYLPHEVSYEELINQAKIYIKDVLDDIEVMDMYWNRETLYLARADIKNDNFRKDETGRIFCIDYGDFYLGNLSRNCVAFIDYK